MYSTFKEQEESEKIENCTVPEIKVKILNLLLLKNKSTWIELFKNKVAGKSKLAHTEFIQLFKGYLCYKATSQNVSPMAQLKNFFIL